MCGIVGFTGRENALPILIKGLYSLEYRGYDSAGVAAFTKDGLRVVKARAALQTLRRRSRRKAATCTAPAVSATPVGPPTASLRR